MKKFLVLFMFVCLIVTVQSCNNAKVPEANDSPLVGVWEYELENEEGMCIYTDTHFIWVLSQKDRKSFQGDQPTESEKAEAFSSAHAYFNTYEHVGPSRVTVHTLFSTSPSSPGTEFTFEYEFEGDLMKYWIIQPDGTRGTMGKARRVKQ